MIAGGIVRFLDNIPYYIALFYVFSLGVIVGVMLQWGMA